MDEELCRISLVPIEGIDGDDPTCATFCIENEDHTLANALRYVVTKNPDVEYCGYSIPHPTEDRLHFRIQTRSASATEALRKGLQDLRSVAKELISKYQHVLELAQFSFVDQDDL